MVEIKKLNPNLRVKIFAKLEGFNPGGSMKDRIALAMIEDAEKSGVLKPGKVIIDATNGNTGIGIAMVAAIKGYKAIIVCPENINAQRRQIIEDFGAELILVKPEIWRQGAIEMVNKMASEDPRLVVLDQFSNKESCAVHFRTTGKEIIKQAGAPIDYFVSCVGTGGTITGIARQLKQAYPEIRVIGIQPRIWPGDSGIETGTEPIMLKDNSPCGDHNKAMVDIIVEVGEKEAKETAKRIRQEEGIFAGVSSGAALSAALRYAEKMEQGTIVTIFPDRGANHLATEMFKV